MNRSLKILWVLLGAIGLIPVMGGNSVLIASSGPSHSTHFVSDKGPHISLDETGCYVCHANADQQCGEDAPFFRNVEDPEGPAQNLAATSVCDPCHSQGGHYDGVAMAKQNWDSGVYDSGGTTLAFGQDKWCISCHDSGTSVCEGVSAPDISGDNTTYGYYVNGHRSKLCSDCHDLTVTHIDGNARTYAFNQAYYAPGESGVAYAASYRLKSMGVDDQGTSYNESVPLMIPTNFGTTFSYVGQDIIDNASRLCFSCHDSNEIFDDTPGDGLDTNFRSAVPDPPLQYSYSTGGSNQHVQHIIGQTIQAWDSDWDTGTTGPGPGPGYDTQMTCSSCHNVHGAAGTEGSTNEPMIRDGSLAGRTGYGFSYVVNSSYPVVTSDGASLPISVGAVFRNGNALCSTNCHLSPTPSSREYDAQGSGSGTYLEYYRAVGTFNCSDCHAYGTGTSHPTHADSSGKGVDLACFDCHDSDGHVNNTTDFINGDLSGTTACDPCHSAGGSYDGVTMAKASWSDGVYSVDGTALESGKEGWCATCHDDDGPTINGRTAKNVSGDGSVYGYFISGHGGYNVSCTDCHDPGLTHIDAYARTYHAEECDTDPLRTYRNGYRLKLVDGGGLPLVVPRTEDYDSSHFALCYKCHREKVVVGGGNHTAGSGSSSIPYATEPLQTYFAQLVEPYQGTTMWDDPPNNIHTEIHLNDWYCWDSDLRGERWDSAFSCPTCHDPHSKAAYLSHATHSMTRADLGIIYRREIMGWSAWPNTGERSVQGGDLSGCDMCHGQGDHGPNKRYYFMLGTALAEDETPAFLTGLDEGYDITNPQNGDGGSFLGGSFAMYERNGTRTGLLIEDAGEGCGFPVSNNLNTAQDVIDFWYVPTFDFSTNSENHCLVDVFSSPNDYLRIEVKADSTLLFSINYDGTLHSVKSNVLNWTADTPHHIRCTWGVYGMHMYLDRGLEEYGVDSGVNYLGGMNEASLPDDFYVGRRHDEQEPAIGIIDDLKIYGYQYQKFGQPLALFSRLGTLDEVENPERGAGGATAGNVNFFNEGDTPGPDNGPWLYSQHGYAVGIYDDVDFGVYDGVIGFPTSNLNVAEDTIDFWWGPMFSVASNTGARVLFYCSYDADDWWGIRLYHDRLHFIIKENGQVHELYTAPVQDFCYNSSADIRNGHWFHVVCCWGPLGMHIYINDQEAVYDPGYDSGTEYQGGLGALPDWFMLGNTVAGGASHMDSMMDELRIYGYQETSFPQKPQKDADHAF